MPLKLLSNTRKKPAFTLFLLCFAQLVQAQEADTGRQVTLETVILKAYEQNRRLRDVPAAVNYIGQQAFERFSPVSPVAAINTTPGVRMEERSPGSYRINIRGSALRSPFGVRNVKVYFNDLPLTDPGGTTYLNNLGFYNYGSVEVIKGPGSSLYGAGTGGVLLIESMGSNTDNGVMAGYTAGSYGLHNAYGTVTTGSKTSRNTIGYQHQQSDGYRQHSRMRRDVISWTGAYTFKDNSRLQTTFLYSDLFYQTPGALNAAEFNADPKAARPSVGAMPGAQAAQAAIYQKSFVAGASFTQSITTKLQHKIILYGAYNQLLNPAIRNYGRNHEPHVGGRTVFNFQQPIQKALVVLNAGAEVQQGFATYSIHRNRAGEADSLQSYDDVNNSQAFVFAQAALTLARWTFTGGASLNESKIRYKRFLPRPLPVQKREFDNQVAPRFSILHQLKNISIYSSVAKGFSPPTTAELLPTGSAVNLDLDAELGTNYDLGLRGNLFKNTYFDVAFFYFSLQNTIVQRRDAAGGDFYTNAGNTRQYGIETAVRQNLFTGRPQQSGQLWASHTWHHFRYKNFKQLNADFSGNKLPGIPPHTITAGFDYSTRGAFVALTYLYSDVVPLNDANTATADAYHLAGLKLGYQKTFGALVVKTSIGADNLLNQKYSLGNDINAFGGRFFNAAPLRNYFATVQFQWLSKKEEQ